MNFDGDIEISNLIHTPYDINRNILVACSATPMGNVTKYLKKLGMGVYDNENQLGVSRKITRIWGNSVLAHTDWK